PPPQSSTPPLHAPLHTSHLTPTHTHTHTLMLMFSLSLSLTHTHTHTHTKTERRCEALLTLKQVRQESEKQRAGKTDREPDGRRERTAGRRERGIERVRDSVEEWESTHLHSSH